MPATKETLEQLIAARDAITIIAGLSTTPGQRLMSLQQLRLLEDAIQTIDNIAKSLSSETKPTFAIGQRVRVAKRAIQDDASVGVVRKVLRDRFGWWVDVNFGDEFCIKFKAGELVKVGGRKKS